MSVSGPSRRGVYLTDSDAAQLITMLFNMSPLHKVLAMQCERLVDQ